jgi:AcrR family transcriptional regulator
MGAVRPLGAGEPEVRQVDGRPPCGRTDCPDCRKLRHAAVDLAARDGMDTLTSEAIARHAGLSAERARAHYPTLDACLTAAYEQATAHFREVADAALGGAGSWQERLRAAAEATVEAFEERPDLARFCVVEAWRSNLPMLGACRLAGRRLYVEMMAEHGGAEAGAGLRMEMFVGAGHHAVSEELEREADDPDALRERLDRLIEVFEPAPASPSA